jgi:hypothetical protein
MIADVLLCFVQAVSKLKAEVQLRSRTPAAKRSAGLPGGHNQFKQPTSPGGTPIPEEGKISEL